ncbi:MAG: YdcF family protein, partial [Clostridia bacterium]|nr:YdcF family protein [Clostridia bacterium]
MKRRFSAAAEEKMKKAAQAQIERAVVSYAVSGRRDGQALSGLASLDPVLGEKWNRIMDLWEAAVTVNDHLPEALPQDDSLCLVVLGFQLNPDGSMREELIQRLEVVLEASKQYPKAFIVCTGGGTAADDPTATEASRMAQWLEAHGVDASRLIVENKSLTTAQNAMYTLRMLEEQHPQISSLAVISSDYHI